MSVGGDQSRPRTSSILAMIRLRSVTEIWPMRSVSSSRCPSICHMLRVTAVTPLDPPVLRVEFGDGVARETDRGFLLHGTLGEPLKDPDYFRQVRVDDELRTIVWPNGLDPAPELLHGDFELGKTVGQRSAA